MDSVDSNLQTGSDLWQLASIFSDCKSVENRGKNRVVFSSLKRLYISFHPFKKTFHNEASFCFHPHEFYLAESGLV